MHCVQAQILAQAAFEVSCERHVELELLRDNEVRNDSAVIAVPHHDANGENSGAVFIQDLVEDTVE